MSAFGSAYPPPPSPPPLSMPNNDAQSMMLQMGLRYGQNVLQEGEKSLMQHMPFISSVYRYFRVDNQYVKRKLGILLFPFTRNFHRMEQSSTEHDDQLAFNAGGGVSPTSSPGQTYPSRNALPLNDVFACDLYLPLMGAVTYVILSAVLYGMRHNSLTIEYLLSSASSLVFWLAVKVCALKAACYAFRVKPEISILDLMALCGYMYIPLCLIVLLREILQLESDVIYVGVLAVYVLLSNGCFLWKSITRMYQREDRIPPQARMLAFSASFLQVPFVFWFAIKPFQ